MATKRVPFIVNSKSKRKPTKLQIVPKAKPFSRPKVLIPVKRPEAKEAENVPSSTSSAPKPVDGPDRRFSPAISTTQKKIPDPPLRSSPTIGRPSSTPSTASNPLIEQVIERNLKRYSPAKITRKRASSTSVNNEKEGQSALAEKKSTNSKKPKLKRVFPKKEMPNSEELVVMTLVDIAKSIPRGDIVKRVVIDQPTRPTRAVPEENLHHNAPEVQMVNGRIVVDQSSLMIEHNEDVPIQDDDVVEVFETGNNSSSYSTRRASASWTGEETQRFYKYLRQFGTDFSMMAHMFPSRTRKQLKAKFKREEKEQPQLIELTLNSAIPIEQLVCDQILQDTQ